MCSLHFHSLCHFHCCVSNISATDAVVIVVASAIVSAFAIAVSLITSPRDVLEYQKCVHETKSRRHVLHTTI
jgi:hypothetical protein